jgi:PAS domain S-box-containing protein
MSRDPLLNQLAEFLCTRREEIMRRWVDAVRTDPAIATSTKLPHEQLMDHLPLVFDDLAETLGGPEAPRARMSKHAHEHGEHRWWQGFQFTELLREMSVLRRIISVEYLAAFAAEHSEWPLAARAQAETIVHTFFDRLFAESAQQFVTRTEEERSRYRALFESTAGAYIVLRPDDYTVISISDSYTTLTRHDRDQLIGRRLFDVFPELPMAALPNGVDTLRASLERVKTERRADAIAVHRYPVPISTEENSALVDRYWSTINSPVFGPAGELAFIIHRVEDVTPFVLAEQEQGRAAEGLELLAGRSRHLEAEIVRRTQELLRTNDQLRHSEERFKLAVAIAEMGTFEIDLRTDAVIVNEPGRAMYGWPADAPLTFSQVQTHFHPDDRPAVMQAVGRALDPASEIDEFEVEQRIFRTDGALRWIRVRGRALFQGSGPERVPTTCIGTYVDITERKQSEAALLESESRFRQLADSIPQLAWMAKPDGWIFWYNQRWHDYTGKSPEEMAGWGWQSVHDPKELPRIIERWKTALASGEPWQDTFPLRRHDGEFRIHLSRANPFRDADGQITLWFGTNTDITELVHAQEAAQAANRAKDQFIAVLSHELRTPLTPVLASILELNARTDLPAGVTEAVELIRRNVELEARLIDDLLDVTRISKGKLAMDRQVVAIDSVLHDAVRICQRDITRKQVHVSLDLRAPNHRVQGDGARLLQTFWNLLQNAVKFTPSGGNIAVRTEGDAERLRVEISDTGIGIEPDALPRIFEAFDQADETISRRFGGLGLGLALSKALVEAHGGTIVGRSGGRDRGSTFRVELATTTRPLSNGADPVVAAQSAERALRILLVEDHIDTRQTLARLIANWGHSVETAGTSAEAVQAAAGKPFDLVISDLGLPDGHGNELIGRLRTDHPTLRAIAVSGFGTENDVERSLEAGFELHLAKPIGAQRLKAAIAKVAATAPHVAH